MQKRLFIILALLIFFLIIGLFFARHDIVASYKSIFQKQYTVKDISSETQENQGQKQDTDAEVKIHFLDIGQGDATFIDFPDGTQILVDCALDARILEALGRVMSPFDRTIDYLFVTHPDQDHYGGCVDVLQRFDVKHIVYSGYDKEQSPYYEVFQDFIKKEGSLYTVIQKEDTWNIANSSIHFLFPDAPIQTHELFKNIHKNFPTNNTSLVFVLSYGDEDVLFTGDAEFELEEYLMKKYGKVLDVEALKVGHHGSSGSSSDTFLQQLSPEFAFISAGKNNKYGHPTLRTLKRLERARTKVWRTDQFGDILLYINKKSLYVENF